MKRTLLLLLFLVILTLSRALYIWPFFISTTSTAVAMTACITYILQLSECRCLLWLYLLLCYVLHYILRRADGFPPWTPIPGFFFVPPLMITHWLLFRAVARASAVPVDSERCEGCARTSIAALRMIAARLCSVRDSPCIREEVSASVRACVRECMCVCVQSALIEGA